MIKKLLYTDGTNDLKKHHNKAVAHMNLMNLHQDRFQDIQDFLDQYIAMKNVCRELGQNLEDARNMQEQYSADEGVTDSS